MTDSSLYGWDRDIVASFTDDYYVDDSTRSGDILAFLCTKSVLFVCVFFTRLMV